jgi:hypothetical protein
MIRKRRNLTRKRVSFSYQLAYAVVQAILDLGNDILRNLGVEDRIEDVGVFFR